MTIILSKPGASEAFIDTAEQLIGIILRLDHSCPGLLRVSACVQLLVRYHRHRLHSTFKLGNVSD